MSRIFKMDDNPEQVIRNNVLNISHAYILALILSELILDLFEDTSDSSTNSLSSLSKKKNNLILTIIHIIGTTCYLIPQQVIF